MKKTIICMALIATTIMSTTFAGDRLDCRGYDSKTVFSLIEPIGSDTYVLIETWSRSAERAKYSDLFKAGIMASSVKELMESNEVISKYDYFDGTFTFDQKENTITISKNKQVRLNDDVMCKYFKNVPTMTHAPY